MTRACWWVMGAVWLAPQLASAAGGGACGVVTEPADWTRGDAHGDLSATSAAACRARGLGVIRRYATEDEALVALAGGAIDAAAGITPSQDRIRQYGVSFAKPFMQDEIRFMVRFQACLAAMPALARRTVCFITGEVGETAALKAAHDALLAIIPSPFEEEGEMGAALAGGRCAAVADTRSRLDMLAAQFPGVRFVLLPGAIGSVPASVASRASSSGGR